MPILMKEFNYTTVMQCPKLQKIVLNQGLGEAVADKHIVDVAQQEMTLIAGQKAVATVSKKDIANFKVRKKMPIGVRVCSSAGGSTWSKTWSRTSNWWWTTSTSCRPKTSVP